MNKSEVLKLIRDYIANQALGGDASDLDENTPLLELGIINSLEIVALVAFAKSQFAVSLPYTELTGANLKNLSTLSDLIIREQRLQQSNVTAIMHEPIR